MDQLINILYADSIKLQDGFRQIDRINDDLLRNGGTSDLACSLMAVAHSSAKTAVNANPPDEKESAWWGIVKDDTLGAFVGAQTAAGIAAIPGTSVAALGFASALGGPVLWIPAAGALMAAVVMSGLETIKARKGGKL